MKNSRLIQLFAVLALLVFAGPQTFAAGKGGWSLGGALGIINADQDDMNGLIQNADETVNISTSELGNAWEIVGFLAYRMQGSSLAFHFRPSYFYQKETGSGGGNSYDYSVTAFTFIPTLRWYMLEDSTIKFFSQFGVGWGFVNGTIKEANAEIDFSGSDMGFLAGLGAEFCFIGARHCIVIEGNMRFLAAERVLADSTATFAAGSLTQSNKGEEVEFNDEDLGVSLSGIQGLVGYGFYF